jgi:hypothetical protein
LCTQYEVNTRSAQYISRFTGFPKGSI